MVGGSALNDWRRPFGVWARAGLAVGLAATLAATPLLAQDVDDPGAPPPEQSAAAPTPAVIRPYQPPAAPNIALRPDQVDLLRHALADAETQGFEHEAFTPANLDSLLRSKIPGERRAGEIALMEAIFRYAHALHSGRLPASAFEDLWGLRPAPFDPSPGFVAAVSGDRLAAWLDGLAPPYSGYQSLRTALATYRAIAADGGWNPIPAGPDLKLGMIDKRVAALRARLAIEDPTFAAEAAVKSPRLFDAALSAAVIRAQKRYGEDPTGVVGKATLAALNAPASQRVAQILANMERWRWLPQSLPTDRVQVNIAAAVLTVFHSDTPTLSMRAATGRPDDQTPMLASEIGSVVLNPPWNVPASIAKKELWPKEKANPGYLARNDFIVIKTPDGGERLQQKAGPKAALGRVKFDFPNPYGVYLHDTPSRGAFGKYARQVSHGCVRLEKPVVLADALFEGDAKWTSDQIQTTLDGGHTVRATLPTPIAVYLFYWTAFVGPDGMTNFRADPYDWDAALMQRIAAVQRGSA